MKLDIAEVAFQGFRLAAKRPLVVLTWAAVYLVGFVVIFVAGGLLMAAGSGAGSQYSPAAMTGGVFFIIAGFVVLGAVMLCAAYRAALRPEDSAFAYLRVGWAELRMAGLLLVLFIVSMVVAFVVTLLLGVFIMSAFRGSTVGSLVTSLISWALVAFVLVRFSLTGVINFAEGKFGLTDSWDMTRGNFWRLLAIYLILLVYLVLVSLAGGFIGGLIQSALGMPNPWTSFLPQAAAPVAPASPMAMLGGFLATMGITVILSGLNTLILWAPHAAAYKALSAPESETTSEIFS